MKIVFRTLIFHLLCILIFSILYYIFRDDYREQNQKKSKPIDYLFLSTTIQAGVGISDIYPTDFYGKIIMIVQQLLMLFTNIFTIYILTL
jgi:hypothetical protein